MKDKFDEFIDFVDKYHLNRNKVDEVINHFINKEDKFVITSYDGIGYNIVCTKYPDSLICQTRTKDKAQMICRILNEYAKEHEEI